jgi:hypothetical protein
MSDVQSTLCSQTGTIGRQELALVPYPNSTLTHKVVPHHEVVNALVETLGFRHIGVVKDQYAVSKDGMKLFGTMELETTSHGVRFALGIRNSHDKSLSLGITVGYKVLVCDNLSFWGDFTPVMKKHTKGFELLPALAYGVDQMQRNFQPMVQDIERWQDSQISDVAARLLIYEAFIEGTMDIPRHLARPVHHAYFNPPHEEFAARSLWSLQNAFTEGFKQLEPIPMVRATNELAGWFAAKKL